MRGAPLSSTRNSRSCSSRASPPWPSTPPTRRQKRPASSPSPFIFEIWLTKWSGCSKRLDASALTRTEQGWAFPPRVYGSKLFQRLNCAVRSFERRGPQAVPETPWSFRGRQPRAHSVPVRYADRTGAVIREAIEGVSGDRTQIGGAARNPHRHRSHGVVAIVAMPVAVVCVVAVGIVADAWILSGSRVGSGFRPGGSRRRLIE